MKYKVALVIIQAIYKFVIPRDWTAVGIPFMSVPSTRIQIIGWGLQGERVPES